MMSVLLSSLLLLFLGVPNSTDKNLTTTWHGGVVPHHLLVVEEIEKFWKTASVQFDPDIIVLVGPDHENMGQTEVTTDQQSYHYLSGLPFVKIDSVVRQDHSIQTHLPIIKKMFPNTSVLSLAIRSDANQQQMMTLAHHLRDQLSSSGEVLVVASVDFSHYLPPDVAAQKDEESLSAVTSFSYNELQFYQDDHMDSDESIMFMSEAVCPAHHCVWEVLYHGNSEDYVPSYSVTTSYFTLFLEK